MCTSICLVVATHNMASNQNASGQQNSESSGTSPAAIVSKVVQAFKAHSETLDSKNFEEVIAIFLRTSSNRVLFERAKAEFTSKSSAGLWDAVTGQFQETLSKAVARADADLEDPEKDLSTSMASAQRIKAWREMFLSSRTSSSKSKAAFPQFAKLDVKLPRYNGQKGRARRWFKKVYRILSTMNPSDDSKIWSQYLAVIDNALSGYSSGQTLLNQLCRDPTHLLPGGIVDLKSVMRAFIDHHDQHSMDLLFQEWTFLKQADRETIGAFVVRFKELVEDITLQGYKVPESNAWIAFRNKVRRASKLRETKEVNDMHPGRSQVLGCL